MILNTDAFLKKGALIKSKQEGLICKSRLYFEKFSWAHKILCLQRGKT